VRGFDYEEYKMKSKFLKCAVVASALAFMNCSDDATTSPAINNPESFVSSSAMAEGDSGISSSTIADPLGGGAGAEVSSSSVGAPDSLDPGLALSSAMDPNVPQSSADVLNPASSADTPASSASVAPTSSEVTPASSAVAPASSSVDAPASSATVASSSSDASASSATEKTIFLAEGNEEEKDQLKVVYKTNTGWNNGGILCYPEKLSDTQKHGIVVWGPGGGEQPGKYEGMIRRLASHGFVVIALSESPGDASQAIKALDWLDKQNKDNNSPLYGKLDMNVVGCSGHSMGGLESEQAAIKDKRVITAFLNNSGDRNGGAFKNIPATKTAGVVFGEKGMEHDNAIADYNSAKSVPACMIEMTGGPMNGEGGYGHGSGPWDGMAVTIAWMRWHLGGEDFRKADFVGSSGKYINGNIAGHQGKWKGQCKNFN